MGVVRRAQRKQWPSPKTGLVLGVQELLGFKVSQRMAVSIQRLRSEKAELSTGGRAFKDCWATPATGRHPYKHTGPSIQSKRLRIAGAVWEPRASPRGARPLGEGSASAGLCAPAPAPTTEHRSWQVRGQAVVSGVLRDHPGKHLYEMSWARVLLDREYLSGGGIKGTPTHFRIQEGQKVGLSDHIPRLRHRTWGWGRDSGCWGRSTGKNEVSPRSD